MLGRDREKRHAEERVEARREDFDRRIETVDGKAKRAPSLRPIQLRCIVFVRSGQPVKFVEIVQQAIGVGGDPQEPLREVAPLDEMMRSASSARR